MKKVASKQKNVKFVYCDSPVTIDKTKEWGANLVWWQTLINRIFPFFVEDNFQVFINGAWLKLNQKGIVTHGVQPNDNNTAPVGWYKNKNGSFNKLPIWVDTDIIYQEGETVEMLTLDGDIKYKVTEPSVIVYNDNEGEPNMNDGWVQKVSVLERNYNIKLS